MVLRLGIFVEYLIPRATSYYIKVLRKLLSFPVIQIQGKRVS